MAMEWAKTSAHRGVLGFSALSAERSAHLHRPLHPLAECFPARLRYSGASLGYHLASVVAGGPAPLIAVALLAHYGTGYAVAGYIFVSAIASLSATLLLPDYTNKDISAH